MEIKLGEINLYQRNYNIARHKKVFYFFFLLVLSISLYSLLYRSWLEKENDKTMRQESCQMITKSHLLIF